MCLNRVKLLLLRLIVETSSYVALYAQVPRAYPNPNCIGSPLFMPCRSQRDSVHIFGAIN